MSSPYDLITVSPKDLSQFEEEMEKSRIGKLIILVLRELPGKFKCYQRSVAPYLKAIEGFEDQNVKGYEVVIEESREIERFVRSYIPFFILKKRKEYKLT